MKERFMQEAILLSRKMMHENKSGPFGAIIVKDNNIVGKGYNQVTSHNDPTAHAEIQAIRNACQQLNTFDLTGTEIYTSCEPCPMCLSAIWWAKIEKIIYAANREDASNAGFRDNDFYQELNKNKEARTVTMEEILREEALLTFDEWLKKTDKIPY
ncbi:MAG: Guanine deaminase [Legionellaceae bacterium]